MINYEDQKIISKKGIMVLYGLSDYQASKIIRQAKVILVANGYEYYNNRRVGRVPHDVVKQLLALDEQKEH